MCGRYISVADRRAQLNVLTKAQLLERLHKLIGYADFSDLETAAKRATKPRLIGAVLHAESDPANWRRMANA